MKKIFILLLIALTVVNCSKKTYETQSLCVHPDGRYLMYENGRPFFWMGDTAWNLFDKNTVASARKYLTARKMQGFNIVQCSLLFGTYGVTRPNVEGQLAFEDLKTLTPNEKYFDHMVEIIELADSLGMYVGLLPQWAENVTGCYNYENIIFKTEEQMYNYGKYLGSKLKDKKNIVWILGGDRPATGIGNRGVEFDHISMYDAEAKGIAEGICGREDYSCCLMTYHPNGWQSSAKWFHNKPWLDFNMQQNGHGYADATWANIARDYALEPHKPLLDGESTYDEHYIDFKVHLGITTDYHTRRCFYHEVFAGAFGHTYGTTGVWQFYDPSTGETPSELECYSWERSLGRASGYQMIYGKNLMLSRPFFSRIPDNSFVYELYDKADHITATRDIDRTYAFIYTESGRPIHLDLTVVGKGKKVKAWWYDPRSGKAFLIGLLDRVKDYTFVAPTEGPVNDWVLVLDAPEAHYPAPGTTLVKK